MAASQTLDATTREKLILLTTLRPLVRTDTQPPVPHTAARQPKAENHRDSPLHSDRATTSLISYGTAASSPRVPRHDSPGSVPQLHHAGPQCLQSHQLIHVLPIACAGVHSIRALFFHAQRKNPYRCCYHPTLLSSIALDTEGQARVCLALKSHTTLPLSLPIPGAPTGHCTTSFCLRSDWFLAIMLPTNQNGALRVTLGRVYPSHLG